MRLPNLPSLSTLLFASDPKLWATRYITLFFASFISLIAMAGMSIVVEPGAGWGGDGRVAVCADESQLLGWTLCYLD